MSKEIKISEIYDQNINFIFGSGASYGLLPTLALKLKDQGVDQSIETLATKFDDDKNEDLLALLFMHYYRECIEPAMLLNEDDIDNDAQKKVFENYETFLQTLLLILSKRKSGLAKKCNIFTTNYDGCFTYVAEKLLQTSGFDFVMNDGSHGFKKRLLNSRNFNKKSMYTGVFDRHQQELVQINLIHLHGSVYWYGSNDSIEIDYNLERNKKRVISNTAKNLNNFSDVLKDSTKSVSDLTGELEDELKENFWKEYKTLPVVNPTKWKFHETVFEEHYYQMLRYLSYELEKPNSILIVFGFSFKDEHIRNLVKRSLSNPQLHLFICCRNQNSANEFKEMFKGFLNVEYIVADDDIDFSYFNKNIFTLNPRSNENHEDQGVPEQ